MKKAKDKNLNKHTQKYKPN